MVKVMINYKFKFDTSKTSLIRALDEHIEYLREKIMESYITDPKYEYVVFTNACDDYDYDFDGKQNLVNI